MENIPFVSVIIPVFNDYRRLDKCLETLLQQTFIGEIEIIVADNNSSCIDESILDKYRGIIKIVVKKPGSYAARNSALQICKGDIIAFTDSDCIPELDWVEAGVRKITSQKADLLGGKIEIFSENKNQQKAWVELFEFELAFPQRENVKIGRSVTANLFITNKVLKTIGKFEEDTYSGADYKYTEKAVSLGFKLIYGDNVRVKHPARRSIQQIRKKIRRVVGGWNSLRSSDQIMADQFKLKNLIKDLSPPFQATKMILKCRKVRNLFWVDIFKILTIAWHNKLYKFYLKSCLLLGIGINKER